ncbi:DUF4286 family protein [Chloroflexota bacterium]
MAKWLVVVETNSADTARETEFNEWYDKTHLPDAMEAPEFIRATRYENIKPKEGEAKYLALYEVETDDIDRFRKTNAGNIARLRAEGRLSELLVIVSSGIYKQISSLSK